MDSKESKIDMLFRNSSPPTQSTILALLCLIYVLAFSFVNYFSNPMPYKTTKLKKGENHSEQAANKTLSTTTYFIAIHQTTYVHVPRNVNSALPSLQTFWRLDSNSGSVYISLSSGIFSSEPSLFPHPFYFKSHFTTKKLQSV